MWKLYRLKTAAAVFYLEDEFHSNKFLNLEFSNKEEKFSSWGHH
jgi:hypothetical protein